MKDMNWIAVYPELLLLVMALVVTMVDLWVTDPKRTPTYLLTQVSLAAVAGLHLAYFDAGFTVYGCSAWSSPTRWAICSASSPRWRR